MLHGWLSAPSGRPGVSIAALLRRRLHRVAARLGEIGALPDHTTIARAAAILWFYFGFTAWRELHVLGRTWKETEQ
jgi:hypothetical protein